MLPITQSLITNRSNRPQTKLQKLKGIIIHWTANYNNNADADAHYRYFQNHSINASAHYFVDSEQIIQIIPDDEVAYHVGSRTYKTVGESIRENGYSPNHFLIGIEMCVNPESDWDTTYKNTVELTQHLLAKYNLSTSKVWRHYDITGKDCPKMMSYEEDEGWARFKDSLINNVYPDESNKIGTGIVNTNSLNVRQGNGTYFSKVNKLQLNDKVDIYESIGEWYRIDKGQWVAKAFITAQQLSDEQQAIFKGIVNTANLNVRSGASTSFPIVGKLNKGNDCSVYAESGNWYHIGNNRWVHKNFVDKAKKESRKGIVNVSTLNIRKGAGTNQTVVGQLKKNAEVEILEERNNWIRIGENKWVYSIYILETINRSGKVTASTLNIRMGPGTVHTIVKSLKRNDSVEILSEDGDWYRIWENQWVHKDFIRIEQL